MVRLAVFMPAGERVEENLAVIDTAGLSRGGHGQGPAVGGETGIGDEAGREVDPKFRLIFTVINSYRTFHATGLGHYGESVLGAQMGGENGLSILHT